MNSFQLALLLIVAASIDIAAGLKHRSQNDFCLCGRQDPRVAKYGNYIRPDSFPWIVRMFKKSNSDALFPSVQDDGFFCMGTLINSQYVLTALSCVANKTGSDIALDKGEIGKIIVGPEAHPELNLALIRLVKPIRFDNNTLPACLYESEVKSNFMSYVGWSQNKMSRFYVRDLSQEDAICRAFPHQMICSKTLRFMYTFCTIDAGGPLQFEGTSDEAIVGITLLGSGRSSNMKHNGRLISYESYQYSARLTKFLPWIRSVVQDNYCSY